MVLYDPLKSVNVPINKPWKTISFFYFFLLWFFPFIFLLFCFLFNPFSHFSLSWPNHFLLYNHHSPGLVLLCLKYLHDWQNEGCYLWNASLTDLMPTLSYSAGTQIQQLTTFLFSFTVEMLVHITWQGNIIFVHSDKRCSAISFSGTGKQSCEFITMTLCCQTNNLFYAAI